MPALVDVSADGADCQIRSRKQDTLRKPRIVTSNQKATTLRHVLYKLIDYDGTPYLTYFILLCVAARGRRQVKAMSATLKRKAIF